MPFSLGQVEGQFDSSLSIGASWGTSRPERKFIGTLNGGTASTNAADDGRLNFESGEVFSKLFKGVHDLELKYRDSGVFLRGKYWYDFELKDGHQHLYDIDDDGRDQAARGSGGQLLDAFAYHNYSIANLPGSVRLGRQVVSWGESTFIQNGINSINPVDVAALRRPGSEVKEALTPVPMFYINQGLSDSLTVEAFYQMQWEKTVVDNCGTFFGSDTIAQGCDDRLELTPPGMPDTRLHISRGKDRDTRDGGQYGVALRWLAESLNQTEFGLYAMHYHSRSPFFSGTVGTGPFSVHPGTSATTGEYFIEYPEDIRLYGLSFATTLGTTAVAGELSYRPNMPLQLNSTDISNAAVGGQLAALLGDPVFVSGFARPLAGEVVHGYVRKPVSQAQLTLTHFFDQVMAAERLTLVGEVGYNHLADIGGGPLRFGRDGIYGSGALAQNGNCTQVANTANPGECNDKGFYTADSWGYRLRAILDYPNVFANVNLKPSLSWLHDVEGYGPNFNEGSKAVSLGIDADYHNTYAASLSYTDFFGGDYNTATDRDFVALSFGMSF